MIIEYGNIWDTVNINGCEVLCFTSNSVISNNGLVMGAGFARQIRDVYPNINWKFAGKIKNNRRYGFEYIQYDGLPKYRNVPLLIGAFQTKAHYSNPSTISIIENSVLALFKFIVEGHHQRIDCNFPGIGLGGLKFEEVYKTIKYLPDNVHFWIKE